MKSKGLLSSGLIAVLAMFVIVAVAIAVVLFADGNAVNRKAVSTVSDSSLAVEESSEADSSDVESSVIEEDKTVAFPVKSADYKDDTDENLTAGNAILVDVDNNTIIAGKNYDKRIYPASLTKIMTLLVATEKFDDLSKKYTFTYDDIHPLVEENASRAGFAEGETVTLQDLLYSAILVSGGDGTVGVANLTAGSEKQFVELMNQKAKEMGLKNTHFTNTSGLFDENHYSTVEDMAVVLKVAMENETCKKILTAKEYTSSKTAQNPDGIKMTSIVFSRIADYYVENGGKITGGKTGFISESKYSLATTYEFNGRNYICVTSHSEDEWKAVEDTILIYEKYTTGEAAPKSVSSAAESSSKNDSSKASDDSNSAPVREHI